jgi:HAD superfamily hydrolase (TIGR01549 family)
MAPAPLETLFLDAGGVLVNPNWERVAEAFARHGIQVEGAALARAEPLAKREMDTPEYVNATGDTARARRYFDLVFERAGVGPSAARDAALAEVREYHARENLWEDVPGDVPGALRRLREAGLRLVVVSNSNGRLRELLARLGLLDHFAVVIDSHDVGAEKPDPRLFEIALERSSARRESTLHVGDFYEIDVKGARAAGLQAALLDAAGLYEGQDCPRFPTLAALADHLAGGAPAGA